MKRAQLDTVGGKRPKVKRKPKLRATTVQKKHAQVYATVSLTVTRAEMLDYLRGRLEYATGQYDVAVGRSMLAETTMSGVDTRRKSEMEYQRSLASMRLRERIILDEIRNLIVKYSPAVARTKYSRHVG